MRNKVLSGLLCVLLTFLLTPYLVPFKAACRDYTVDEVNDLIGGIVDYKLSQAGAGSVEEWLSGEIAAGAGSTTDWYAITLSQCGYTDMSAYEHSLLNYLGSNNVLNASTREKYALALCAAGSRNSYISDILDGSIGQQGMMSWIYGLHILNNGYTCSKYTADGVVDTLLSMQYDDGGWALFGDYGDIDVTAMTVQALAPYYSQRGDVENSVDRALDFLSERQKEDGGYESFGNPNPESASQVLVAVSALGIDCRYDDRFIKDGNNLIDGITLYRLDDGSFSHIRGGSSNPTATIQAYYSLVAFRRMTEGRSPLLILDNRQPLETPQQGHEAVNQGGSNNSGNTVTSAASLVTTAASSAVTGKSTTSRTTALTTVSKRSQGTSAATVTSLTIATSATATVLYKTDGENDTSETSRGGYKPAAVLIIIGSAAVLALILFILGKRSYKNFIFLGIAAGAVIAVVLLTDIKSTEEYYSGEKKRKENAIGSVTMEIRCDTIAGKSDSEHIPADGVILPPVAFDIEVGDTVFDILTEAAQTYGIQIENKGSAGSAHGMVYISGINYIYEFDFGDLSGWVYHVNGITPSKSCGEYELSDGDRIEWLYTCEIGHDLNEVYEE